MVGPRENAHILLPKHRRGKIVASRHRIVFGRRTISAVERENPGRAALPLRREGPLALQDGDAARWNQRDIDAGAAPGTSFRR